MNHQEIPELCAGNHVGKTECKRKEIMEKLNKEKMEEDVPEDPMKKSDMISNFNFLKRQNKGLSNGHDGLLKCMEKLMKQNEFMMERMENLEKKVE